LLQSLYGLFLTVFDPNACFFVDETFNRLALGGPGYRFLFGVVSENGKNRTLRPRDQT
jgi:hypothetical protein